ncbi:helix-turn-helix transcriptional regulator [Paracoccus aestuariivivens]|uniref:Helix-turn-helix domain-containing protein n=1 Tax=Paracoccus aestuariivivens TaxID=1820333 RepID=A0A6L6J6C0_9RHOB|nr:AraC family transcriptional regulator [Paracoccus aestuariivivens]MTH77106.1 helix-turn-helix domain-containing protein [Paracoccus aestuariivivens]
MSAQVQTMTRTAGATDSLGCSTSVLSADHVLCSNEFVFRRKAASGLHHSHVATPAQDRGLLVGISLVDGHRRKGGEAGRVQDRLFDRGDAYIRDFDNDYAATMDGYFDFFLIELSQKFVDEAERITDRGKGRALSRVQGHEDQILRHLAQALVPALAQPDAFDPLFIEQLATAVGAHLLHNYRSQNGLADDNVSTLAPMLVRRAKEMLMSGEDEKVSIAHIAEALNLSRHGFFRAFRDSTGVTPYQWLLNQRIDHARRLLATTDLTLVEVALTCGFSDQSHFTRVFGRIEGMSPGRWRDRAR